MTSGSLDSILQSLTRGLSVPNERKSVLSVTGATPDIRIFDRAKEWEDALKQHSLSVDEASTFEGNSHNGDCKLVILRMNDDNNKTSGYLVSTRDDGTTTLRTLPTDLDQNGFTIKGNVDRLLLDGKATQACVLNINGSSLLPWRKRQSVSVGASYRITQGGPSW